MILEYKNWCKENNLSEKDGKSLRKFIDLQNVQDKDDFELLSIYNEYAEKIKCEEDDK